MVTQGRAVGLDDFTHGRDEMAISVEIDDFVFRKGYRRNNSLVEEEALQARPNRAYIERTLSMLQDEGFDVTSERNQVFIKDTAKLFGMTVRANSQ